MKIPSRGAHVHRKEEGHVCGGAHRKGEGHGSEWRRGYQHGRNGLEGGNFIWAYALGLASLPDHSPLI